MEIRDIKGYEGLYTINELGMVYGVKSKKILKTWINKNGYIIVDLWKNNKRKHASIHSLLADLFIPNPLKKPCINHINGIKTDNRIENLERCTFAENNKHAHKMGLNYISELNRKVILEKIKRPVIQMDLLGEELNCFKSIIDAETQVGLKIYKSKISMCCMGKRNTCGGFKWKYAN